MSKANLLLVDPDESSRRVLDVSLRKAGFQVTTAVDGNDALRKVSIAEPDLVISEVDLPELDGFDFRERMQADSSRADIPFIFLTKDRTLEQRIRGLSLGVEEYLTKPIFIKEIVVRIRMLLQRRQREALGTQGHPTSFRGDLTDMTVVDLVQMMELGRRSGTIRFRGQEKQEARIFFRDGNLIDAALGRLQGSPALFRLLIWNAGSFEINFEPIDRNARIEQTNQVLLMEGMRRIDDWGRLLEQLPPLDSVFEVDYSELAERLAEIPDELNGVIRLFDGKRTLMQVVDSSALGDLETLGVISKFYFEGLIYNIAAGKPRLTVGRISRQPTMQQLPMSDTGDAFAAALEAQADRPQIEVSTLASLNRGIGRPAGERQGYATRPIEMEVEDESSALSTPTPVLTTESVQMANRAMSATADDEEHTIPRQHHSRATEEFAVSEHAAEQRPETAIGYPAEDTDVEETTAGGKDLIGGQIRSDVASGSVQLNHLAGSSEGSGWTINEPPSEFSADSSMPTRRRDSEESSTAEQQQASSSDEHLKVTPVNGETAQAASNMEYDGEEQLHSDVDAETDSHPTLSDSVASRIGEEEETSGLVSLFAADYPGDHDIDEFDDDMDDTMPGLRSSWTNGTRWAVVSVFMMVVAGGYVSFRALRLSPDDRAEKVETHADKQARDASPAVVGSPTAQAVHLNTPKHPPSPQATATALEKSIVKTKALSSRNHRTIAHEPPASSAEGAGDQKLDENVLRARSHDVASEDPAPNEAYRKLVRRANSARRRGRTSRAKALYRQALKSHPNGWEALSELALAALDRGRSEMALGYALRAKAANKQAPHAYLVIGAVFQERGKLKRAKEAYRHFLSLCPKCRFSEEIRAVLRTL